MKDKYNKLFLISTTFIECILVGLIMIPNLSLGIVIIICIIGIDLGIFGLYLLYKIENYEIEKGNI